MKRFLPCAAGCALLLAACAVLPRSNPQEPTPAAVGQVPAGIDPFAPANPLARIDDQGAVVVEVTPVNLSAAPDEIAFDVAMNTHSVDLSMNLASLASLSTDTGISVQPTLWSAPQGGHHVRGTLVFPAEKDGSSVLAGATRIRLTIEGVDAPARVFEWELK